jgi:hypothetical protein
MFPFNIGADTPAADIPNSALDSAISSEELALWF